jgi:hypothetical protein
VHEDLVALDLDDLAQIPGRINRYRCMKEVAEHAGSPDHEEGRNRM